MFRVNKISGDIEGHIILAGDFNEVMDVILDKSRPKGLIKTKDREAIHMLKEDMGLTDIWRLTNPSKKEYTFYSHCHRSHSQIDFFLITHSLINRVVSCDIRTIAITDHAAVELCLRVELEGGHMSRWRMNVSLLQDQSFKKSLGEDLKSFFEINRGSTEEIKTVWEDSKAFVRGKFIAYANPNPNP